MTHLQASSLATYLNSIYTGPVDGVFAGCAAFTDKRTCEADSAGRWRYYVCSPFGAYLNGRELTFKEVSDAIADAMEVLRIA